MGLERPNDELERIVEEADDSKKHEQLAAIGKDKYIYFIKCGEIHAPVFG